MILRFIYPIIVRFSNVLLSFIALFNPKIKKIIAGRKETQLFFSKSQSFQTKNIWIHCASLGEWEQAIPVAELLKIKGFHIFLSFYSPSGFVNAKRMDLITRKFYLPSDLTPNYKPIIDHISPQIVVFVRYDLWPNMLKAFKNKGIPTILIAAEFRNESRYLKANSLANGMIKQMNYICTNDQASKETLNLHGYQNVTFTGSPKVERVIQNTQLFDPSLDILKNLSSFPTIIIGSAWSPEIKLISNWYNKYKPKVNLIIVPHELNANSIQLIQSHFPDVLEFSKLTAEQIQSGPTQIVVDKFGLLSQLYRFGTIAIIGGGFGAGIHNILEPSVYGLPVLSGPKNKKFSEAMQLINLGSYFSVTDQKQFDDVLNDLIANASKREEIKKNLIHFFHKTLRASENIYHCIEKLVL